MLDGFEHYPRTGVGAFTGGGNKLLLHTTEGGSVSGAIATLDKNRSWSHFLISYEEKRKIQFIEIGQSAKALGNNSSDGYDTNRANCVQVEIVGYSKEAGGWSKNKLDWIAGVLKEIRASFDYPLTTTGKERMGDKQFVDYAGLCCHYNAPDNDHWDCGDLDMQYLASKIGGNMSTDALTKEEIIVAHRLIFNSDPNKGTFDAWLGKPLSAFLTSVNRMSATLRAKVSDGRLVPPNSSDCTSAIANERARIKTEINELLG